MAKQMPASEDGIEKVLPADYRQRINNYLHGYRFVDGVRFGLTKHYALEIDLKPGYTDYDADAIIGLVTRISECVEFHKHFDRGIILFKKK
jgi:hypothetical protein